MNTRSPSPTPAERSAATGPDGPASGSYSSLDAAGPVLLPDNLIDLAITNPRGDVDQGGRLELESPRGTSPGPRQRRFTFDAGVIRDTVVMKMRSLQRDDIANPIDECHREAVYKRCTGCRVVKTFYNRCERFYCPICAARLARDRRESVEWWSKCIRQAKHVILTVKSVEHLTKAYVRELKRDFRKLRSMKWAKEGERWQIVPDPIESRKPGGMMRGKKMTAAQRKRWTGPEVFANSTRWRGGFWSIDATWHKDIEPGQVYTSNGTKLTAEEPVKRGWHIHFHIIVDADFINQDRLSTEWAKIRGQEMSVVRVYDVQGKNYTAEACKYVCDGVQLAEWPAEKLADFADALGRERCFDTFGTLYKQRAEWRAALDDIQADRQLCACGCSQWEIFNSNEWEWQQAKSSLSPPITPRLAPPVAHPEFFNPAEFRPAFVKH
jgi:hypothetical protein